ncbi:hypothetical protein KJ951_00430, partial [Patescibacteria group bacterium]|nr:hypothetical protein [Patescibacteria group bacterium]MBU1702849.1 hypothetical protein [Patescibacteria group bacterium]
MQKNCRKCMAAYDVSEEDLAFYNELSPVFNGKKYEIPAPEKCPDCRQQQRLAWRNERTLYFRKCDGTGKRILSVFSPDKPFKAYHSDYWYSDKWDAKQYGRDFDFSRPFFEQFEELMKDVPQLALSVLSNQNSEFVNQAGWNKNCYLIFEAAHDENCYYGNYVNYCRDCMDTLNIVQSELCYECTDCQNCYNLKFSQDCVNCSDSWFLKDCIGCKNCFGCVNLKNKEYFFLNKKCAKEEYERKVREVNVAAASGLKQMRRKFTDYTLQFSRKFMHGIQNENSDGDYVSNTQNCHNCFDLINSQDCKNVISSYNMKKVHDVCIFGGDKGAEFSYNCHEIGDSVRNICFSDQIWSGVSDVYYSKLCLSGSTQLFGCVGLRHAKYCIMNKQYTKEEYDELVPKIIEHMRQAGEWGEFFPAQISPFGYNETIANVYYPLKKEECAGMGLKWKDSEETPRQGGAKKAVETIAEVTDSIFGDVLRCEDCGKGYKIIAQELAFYRGADLPLPHVCADCRHKA